MRIYWKCNYFKYKSILKQLNNYWRNIDKNETYDKNKTYTCYCTETYSIFVYRYAISMWSNSLISGEIKEEIHTALKIIFNDDNLTGYVDSNLSEDETVLLEIISSIPTLHKDKSHIPIPITKDRIFHCIEYMEKMRGERDEQEIDDIISVLKTVKINI